MVCCFLKGIGRILNLGIFKNTCTPTFCVRSGHHPLFTFTCIIILFQNIVNQPSQNITYSSQQNVLPTVNNLPLTSPMRTPLTCNGTWFLQSSISIMLPSTTKYFEREGCIICTVNTFLGEELTRIRKTMNNYIRAPIHSKQTRKDNYVSIIITKWNYTIYYFTIKINRNSKLSCWEQVSVSCFQKTS